MEFSARAVVPVTPLSSQLFGQRAECSIVYRSGADPAVAQLHIAGPMKRNPRLVQLGSAALAECSDRSPSPWTAC
jgi:hypothetical protein